MFNTGANVPVTEIQMRIQRLQNKMAAAGLDGVLILQGTDLYYFCGSAQQAHLYIPVQGDPVLMVKKSVWRALAESPLDTIEVLERPSQLPGILKRRNCPIPRTLGMELDVLPVNLYHRYLDVRHGVDLQDCSRLIRQVRAIKSTLEIDLIRKAAGLADRMAAFAGSVIKEGVPEIELALDFVKHKGHAQNFMGADDGRVPFIGHGIGLALDEFPFLAAGHKMKLQEGMIIALEPKLIFPGQGVVGIEHTHLVTADGLERLTLFEDGITSI